MEYRSVAISSLLVLGVGFSASASATVVSSFAPSTSSPAAGVWYENSIVGNSQASIVSLAGVGGNLENNQPLPVGAARLTTGFSDSDKAQVGVVDAYGNASAFLSDPSFGVQYSYYKENVPGGNVHAAPSLKLAVSNNSFACFFADCFGELVYEPTWNQPGGGSQASPSGDWQSVAVDANSLFWWTGGFGQANGGGGDVKTLTQWIALLAQNANFGGAELVEIGMGVGTYNQGQDGYFDDVQITSGGYSAVYNFEPPVDVPVPSTVLLMLLGGVAGAAARKRTRKS